MLTFSLKMQRQPDRISPHLNLGIARDFRHLFNKPFRMTVVNARVQKQVGAGSMTRRMIALAAIGSAS
jgi:hypothetical protein